MTLRRMFILSNENVRQYQSSRPALETVTSHPEEIQRRWISPISQPQNVSAPADDENAAKERRIVSGQGTERTRRQCFEGPDKRADAGATDSEDVEPAITIHVGYANSDAARERST